MLNWVVAAGIAASQLSPFQDTPPMTTAYLLEAIDFWYEKMKKIRMTYDWGLIFDMERFWHLVWANLMSCKFSLSLFLIPLYIFQASMSSKIMFCRVAAMFVPKVCSLISSHLKFDDICTIEGFVRLLLSLVIMISFFLITVFSHTWAYLFCRHISLLLSFCFQGAKIINNSWNIIDSKHCHSQICRLHGKITLVGLVKGWWCYLLWNTWWYLTHNCHPSHYLLHFLFIT
jgi:membrane glycosyltransferase